MEYITLIIGLASPVIYGLTLFYFLRERKSALRSVVYEKQIDACYEIMMTLYELNLLIERWDDKREEGNHNETEKRLTEILKTYNVSANIVRKYNFILPDELQYSIDFLIENMETEINNMAKDMQHYYQREIFYEYKDLKKNIKKFFGIEKLSESNRKVIEHFDEEPQ